MSDIIFNSAIIECHIKRMIDCTIIEEKFYDFFLRPREISKKYQNLNLKSKYRIPRFQKKKIFQNCPM